MFSFSLIKGINLTGIQQQTQEIISEPWLADAVPEQLRKICSFMDYTSLDGADNSEKIRLLCQKACSFPTLGLPLPAAVCLYSPFISEARHHLRNTPVKVATTAAAFPHGQLPIAIKAEEVKYAVREGAHEVDVVISRGTFLAGSYHIVFRELDQLREACHGLTLKVILETGELASAGHIAKASEIAIEAGADFIKTSTGKSTPAATPEAVFVMLQVIKEHYLKTGRRVGIKPAGGIAEPEQALAYYRLVERVLGPEWLTPELFRIGASRLADSIARRLSPNS